jgi:very-short-patch-repair endonuclease
MEGTKFRRQHAIGPYFVDLACVSHRLVIEIDGVHHDNQLELDARRNAFMEGLGWRVIRFAASEVVRNREGVWTEIQLLIADRPSPPLLSSPPSGGEEHEGKTLT